MMNKSVLERYESGIAQGVVTDDAPQRDVVAKLDQLLDKLIHMKKGFLASAGQNRQKASIFGVVLAAANPWLWICLSKSHKHQA